MINKTIQVLQSKKIILYPTDTVWGIGCDATSNSAVQKIYQLKNREESKALIILVSSIEMLKSYVEIPNKVFEVLLESKRPTTIIYENPKGLADNLFNKDDNTIAIRVVQDQFCKGLIERYGKPIVSTSANVSGNSTPKSYSEIEAVILTGVDYIVNLQIEKVSVRSSRILKIVDGQVIVYRD